MTNNAISQKIIELIAGNKIDIKNAVDIVKITMQEVEKVKGLSGADKQKLVLEVISEIARGQDGISGTQDDIISPQVMVGVKVLLENDLVPSIINVIVDASNGKLDVNNVTGCFTNIIHSIFNIISGCKQGNSTTT